MYSDAKNGDPTLKFILDKTINQPILLTAYNGIARSNALVVSNCRINTLGVLMLSELISPTSFIPIFKRLWAIGSRRDQNDYSEKKACDIFHTN